MSDSLPPDDVPTSPLPLPVDEGGDAGPPDSPQSQAAPGEAGRFSFELTTQMIRTAVRKLHLASADKASWYIVILASQMLVILDFIEVWAYYRVQVTASPQQHEVLVFTPRLNNGQLFRWMLQAVKPTSKLSPKSEEYTFTFDGEGKLIIREKLPEGRFAWQKRDRITHADDRYEIGVERCALPVELATLLTATPDEPRLDPLALREGLEFAKLFVDDRHPDKMFHCVEAHDSQVAGCAWSYGAYSNPRLGPFSVALRRKPATRLAAALVKLDREKTTWRVVDNLLHIHDDLCGFLTDSEKITWTPVLPELCKTVAFCSYFDRATLLNALFSISAVLKPSSGRYIVRITVDVQRPALKFQLITEDGAEQRMSAMFDPGLKDAALPIAKDLQWTIKLDTLIKAVKTVLHPRWAGSDGVNASIWLEGRVDKDGIPKCILIRHTIGDVVSQALLGLQKG